MTNADIVEAMQSGFNVVLSPHGSFIVLCEDGSVLDKDGRMVMPADDTRANLYTAQSAKLTALAGLSAEQLEALDGLTADQIVALGVLSASSETLAALAPNVVVLAGGVVNSAPDAANYEVGDKYYDTVDEALYEVVAGTEGNEWAEDEDGVHETMLYIDMENGGIYVCADQTSVMRRIAAVECMDNQAASTAESVADLKTDFNTLLAAMKSAGLMAADS